MEVAVPIKDLKETKKFSNIVEKNDEVIVTKNGYSSFYCISAKKREAEKIELAEAKLMKRLALSEMEIASGKYQDYDKFIKDIKDEYDI